MRTVEEPSDEPVSDRRLLALFVDRGDQAAFRELVARHCGLVLGVCRRVLRDEHAAEDAFQATFLVLAAKASKIRKRASLASWLYAVAYRTAHRASAMKHRRREEPLYDGMTTTDDILAQVADRYEQELLDEELSGLPAKYREPLVLRYLLGKSNQEVADELALALGVVEGRIKRGKERLRLRLARRGVGLSLVLAAVGAATATAQAATAPALVAATAEAAVAFRAGLKPAGADPETITHLAEKELAMTASSLTTSTLAAAVVVAGISVGLVTYGPNQPARAESPQLNAAMAMELAAMAAPDEEKASVEVAEDKQAKLGILTKDPLVTDLSMAGESPADRATQKIEAALATPTELRAVEEPLQDVVREFMDRHEINIQLDTRALDAVGLTSDTPFTFYIKGVSLKSALNLMLRNLADLTWTIRDEVLLITTPEEAESQLITKVYDVTDLVAAQDAAGKRWSDYDTLIDMFKNTVAYETWDMVGRCGTIAAAPFAGADMLVVSQTYQNHEQIEQLLTKLRATIQRTGKEEIPVREKPVKAKNPLPSPYSGGGKDK